VDKSAQKGPQPRPPAATRNHSGRERRRALRAEAAGIILIALAILAYTVLRYGAHINWSAR